MRIFLLLCFFLVFSCATRAPEERKLKKSETRPKQTTYLKEGDMRKLVTKKIPRTGKYSTVTDHGITTERFKREDSETILTLENGELRTEVENMKSGRVLTRTWQSGIMTGLTIAGSKRTTMIVLDKSGNFVQKLIADKGRQNPRCFEYAGGEQVPMDEDSCLELISGFD